MKKRVDPGPALDTPDEELELLALMTPAAVEEAKADDKKKALMAALLLAALGGTLYTWRPDSGPAGRYRNTRTGWLVPATVVRRELDSFLVSHDKTARALAEQLRGGQLSLAQWELLMRRNIRDIHLNAIALQRGGWGQMRIDDFQLAGRIVREQFGFLKRFGLQIADGSQKLDGTLVWRANLYSEAGRNTFYQSLHANLAGRVTHVQSVRHARDSCRDCVHLDRKWFKIGDPAYMLPGNRQCLHNCRCSENFAALGADGAMVEMGAA